MLKKLETWSAGGDENYIYTEDWALAKMFVDELGKCACYVRSGRAFAWQFRLPKRRAEWMTRRFSADGYLRQGIAQGSSIVNQQLTQPQSAENQLGSEQKRMAEPDNGSVSS